MTIAIYIFLAVGLIFAADDAILIKHDGYIGWYRGEYSSVNS